MISVRVERVTPGQAKKWLENNDINRPMSRTHVASLVRAIRNDEFQENGETIKLNGGDRLVDGQHRLRAVVESGRSIKMAVARGVPEEAFNTIDQGKPRSLADLLARDGVKNAGHVATAVRTYWVLVHPNGLASLKMKLSNPEGYEVLCSNPGIQRSVETMAATKIRNLMSLGYAGALHYAARKKATVAEANEFWEGVGNGDGLSSDSPAYILREALIKNRGSEEKWTRQTLLAKCIKAWNAFRSGEDMQRLRLFDADYEARVQ